MIVWEDLQEAGLGIYVQKPGFSYGSDAIALAAFAQPKKGERFLDLGSGSGILSILLAARSGASFLAVEIREELCELSRRSIERNGQSITVLQADLRTLPASFGPFDGIVCNPPYFTGGTPSPHPQRRQSRHQDSCTLEDVAKAAGRLLKNGGKLYLCCPAALFADCAANLVNAGLSPKRVKALPKDFSGILLIEARKGGKPGIRYEF